MLSIKDPADPSNDISSGSYNFHKVRVDCFRKRLWNFDINCISSCWYSSRQHGRALHLRNQNGAEDLSILSTVMGVMQETINHRQLMQRIIRSEGPTLNSWPLPTLVKYAQPNSPSSKRRASKIVEDAWEEWRQIPDYDYDEPSRHMQYHRKADVTILNDILPKSDERRVVQQMIALSFALTMTTKSVVDMVMTRKRINMRVMKAMLTNTHRIMGIQGTICGGRIGCRRALNLGAWMMIYHIKFLKIGHGKYLDGLYMRLAIVVKFYYI